MTCLAVVQLGGHRAHGGCLRALDHGSEVEVSLYDGNRLTAVPSSTSVTDADFSTDLASGLASLEADLPGHGPLTLSVSASQRWETFGYGDGRSEHRIVTDDLSPSIAVMSVLGGFLGGTPIETWSRDGANTAFWTVPSSGFLSAA